MAGANSLARLGDVTRNRPKYQALFEQLAADIHAGHFRPGQALPTEAKFVESLGLSRNTVRQALRKLEEEGVIERVQGRGTFVTAKPQQSATHLDVFGLIVPQLREGFYPSLVEGFQQASAELQQQVFVSSSANDVAKQGDIILQLIDRGVGGVALVPTSIAPTPMHQIRQLQKNGIPLVFCHRTVQGVSAPCVTWSGQAAGRMAGTALVTNGHRRIACLFPHCYSMTDDFERGLRAALETTDSKECIRTIDYGSALPGAYAKEAIHHALNELFTKENRPTAIFCANVSDAEQVYLQAQAFGLDVPRDLSVITFGGAWRDHGLAERISSVVVDEHQVGVRAAQLLHEMRSGQRAIDNNEFIELPIVLLPGETIGVPLEALS